MLKELSHSGTLSYALEDSLYGSGQRYRTNLMKIKAFEQTIGQAQEQRTSGKEIEEKSEEMKKVYDEQEGLKGLIFKLSKAKDAFETLSETEEKALNLRLADKTNNLELALRNRTTGELLAV